MKKKALPRTFYERDTHVVARELLGRLLVRRWWNKEYVGRIIDVESYVGEDDAACHASRGRGRRPEAMYGEAGYAYVYLIYGMYHCFNIVTEKVDFPAAILIRGIAPEKNISAQTNGPGKLTGAMHITRVQNQEDVVSSNSLFVCDDGYTVNDKEIRISPRINVDNAGEDARLPWRSFIQSE